MILYVLNTWEILLAPCSHWYIFYSFFSAKTFTAQIFLRLYVNEFLSEIFKTCNIDNKHYVIYISMKAVMQIFIVIEIQLFKVK